MAKKKTKVDPILVDEDLLGAPVVVEVTEEVKAIIRPSTEKKEKVMIGFHPITGEEVWM